MSALRNGEYTLAGLSLTASANDAECFLMSWTSGNRENLAYYESSAYDTLMKIIASAADGTARMGCLHDAEALLLMNYACAPSTPGAPTGSCGRPSPGPSGTPGAGSASPAW